MGAWKDKLDALKVSVNGPVPFGGTIFGTSENFPLMPAQLLKGGFFALETLDQLADIPYQSLQLNQEVVVGEYILPGPTTHPLTRYRLVQMPPANTKVSEVPSYVLSDYWEEVDMGGGGGDPGDTGWSPMFALENDGAQRVLLKLVGWAGGTGVAPTVPPAGYPAGNVYLGDAGLVDKNSGVSIKGPKGDPGDASDVRPQTYFSIGTRAITPPATVFSGATPQSFDQSFDLTVTNTWKAARWFMILAQAHFSNDNGGDSLYAQLCQVNLFDVGTVTVRDENYSRQDYVNAPVRPSVSKIDLRYTVLIPAAGSLRFRVRMGQTNGGQSLVSNPFIEAFGL